MPNSQILSTVVWVVMFGGMFYLLFFLPESKRRKRFVKLQSELKVDNEVLLASGIIGTVVYLDETKLTISTGPDKVKITVLRNSISEIIEKIEE